MSDKIISLATELQDATLHSPEQCLRDCLENDIGKRGAFKNGKKVMIIALDDNEDNYSISWNQAGMSLSQMMALCDVLKAVLIKDMGY